MKKKSLVLSLKKTKIVNLSTMSSLYGGTDPIETDIHDPEASCGECTTNDTHMTDDKSNTNNSIPTIGGITSIIGSFFACNNQ
ncbi:hypothetical protein [Kordia sp.]|uniref:hypothetical protein n=1 Tax=Kordia sp. TaxID=1965332 RepID=UPI003B5C5778